MNNRCDTATTKSTEPQGSRPPISQTSGTMAGGPAELNRANSLPELHLAAANPRVAAAAGLRARRDQSAPLAHVR